MDIAILVTLGVAIALVVIVWLVHRRRASQQALYDQARAAFPRQHGPRQQGLEQQFLAAANATGKPRGLRWMKCDLHGEPLFATNPTTGEIYALAGAAIGFEAIPGGDMEEVEAVGDIRYVTAVFVYRRGDWQTDGRAIFNLEPKQALERFSGSVNTHHGG